MNDTAAAEEIQPEPSSQKPSRVVPRPSKGEFFSRLRCPNCELDTLDPNNVPVRCTACDATYETQGGILDLAPEGFKSIEHRIYGLQWYAKNYEKGREQLTHIRSNRTLEAEMALSAQFLNLKADTRLLDVACGTATFTRYFAKKIVEASGGDPDAKPIIMGSDLSMASLQQGRRYLAEEGLQDSVFLFRADATKLPVEHRAFNRVHCSAALHLMGNDGIDRALRHFARVLEPKGLCVISTWLVPDNIEELDFYRRIAGSVQAFVNRNLHKFEKGELEARMLKAGMKVVSVSTSQEQITVKARRVS